MSILHVFDMDGTLLPATTASMEIARMLGRVPQLLALERSFAEGTLSTYEFATAACAIYEGLTPVDVARVFEGCTWIDGLPRVLADIRRREEYSAVITMSPNFFADLLRPMGIDEVHASRFPALPLRHHPDPTSILCPADKVTIVQRMLTRLDLGRDHCIAYGDSSSDLPLFQYLRHTIAVNATGELRAIAAVRSHGTDLWEIYQQARTRIDATHQPTA